MRAIRRLYFYAVALVGLEVVVWGIIQLGRTIFNPGLIGGNANRLAVALALTLVGVPVFLIHWSVAQRDAARDPEERDTTIRALFLYGGLLATLIPTAQNALALANRVTLLLFGLQPQQALIGGNQIWSDNLLAILVNVGAAGYLLRVLSADLRARTAPPTAGPLPGVRRLYRYIWTLYGLVYVVSGVQQVVHYLLFWTGGLGGNPAFLLANGIALLAVGLPLWIYWWRRIQASLDEAVERESPLRLGVLYILTLAGVITVLVDGGLALADLLRVAFGEPTSGTDLLARLSGPVSTGVPAALVWIYYSHHLNLAVAAVPDGGRRAGYRRLYNYLLAALGLAATIDGLQQALSFCIHLFLNDLVWGGGLRGLLTNALALLAVGLPVWVLTWRPMQAEAAVEGDPGDLARRSVLRKGYLYLALFATVVGAMVSAGMAIYTLANQALGNPTRDFAFVVSNGLVTFGLFLGFLGYHWQALRRDGRLAGSSLAARHSRFPTLVLDPGDGAFAREFGEAIRRTAPQIPLTVHLLDPAAPAPVAGEHRAVVLPAGLAADPPEALRAWLRAFPGRRIVVPEPEPNWTWIGGPVLTRTELAQQAATALRQLAEGQEVRISPPTNAWMIVGYVFGGLFGLEVLFLLTTLALSSLSNR